MGAVEGFIADSLLDLVTRANAGRSLPVCHAFTGAVLFVDISGYTVFAEKLCAGGAAGVEELGLILDASFTAYARSVRETGGEIACFAGDAFLAYWAAGDGGLSRARADAEECARRLHRVSEDGGVGAGEAPGLHIGLSDGQLWAALLGDPTHWQLLLAGGAVRQACAAAARAATGETVATDTVSIETAPSPAHDSRADVSPLPSEVEVTAHVPPRVRDYPQGLHAWVPQGRGITVLFVRIDGVDEHIPDALAQHQAVVTSLRTAVSPYAESAGTLLLDDKGLVFTVCFGMPQDTDGDDALRAIRAALAVRSELARLGLQCAIGVDTGRGVCMPIGDDLRRHYWSVGPFMHVAAMLMSAATGRVLCTKAVADRVRDVVSLTPEPAMVQKGMLRPIRVFGVGESEAAVIRELQLVGRDDEQAQLDRALEALLEGSGGVLWIVGDAGIGKTTLVDYLRRQSIVRGVTCLTGGTGSVGISKAYGAWEPVFAGLLDDSSSWPALSPTERETRLGLQHHQSYAPLVSVVLPDVFADEDALPELTGQARADAIHATLSELLGVHAPGHLVIVLEDCHWMDSASWRLLVRVAQDHPRVLIALTARPTAIGQEFQALKRTSGFNEMLLAPLRDEAISTIVAGVVDAGSIRPALLEDITHQAKGNPLFAREYALLLATRSRVAPPRVDQPGPIDTERTPGIDPDIQRLIGRRIDALSPTELVSLYAASVIGDRFALDLLGPVARELSPDALHAAVAALIDRQLIQSIDAHAGTYAFHHATIRQVTYAAMTRIQSRELHRRTATALEHAFGEDGAHVTSLAHHWERAGEAGPTIRTSDRAGRQALAAGAFAEAERLLTICLSQADLPKVHVAVADRARWYGELADARHGLGELEPRLAASHHALRFAGAARPTRAPALIVHALREAGRLVWRGWRPVADEDARRRELEIARAYRHSAEVCYFRNDRFGMLADTLSAVAHATVGAPSALLTGARTELGGLLTIGGGLLRARGEKILDETIEQAKATGDEAAQAYGRMIECLYYVGLAEWETVEASVTECQQLCQRIADRVNATNAQAVRFWMNHYREQTTAAYAAACNLRDRAGETGNRQHRAWACRYLALCALREHEPAEANQVLAIAMDALGRTAALNELIPTLGLSAVAQLGSDEWQARATARRALQLVGKIGRPMGHATLEGYSALFTVALDAWPKDPSDNWEQAVQLCLRLLEHYRRSFQVGWPRYYLHRGQYEQFVGNTHAARANYERGRDHAHRLQMPWEERQCHSALVALRS